MHAGVDDLVAVHLAPSAFDLVLGAEWKLGGGLHRLVRAWIVGTPHLRRKT